LNLKPQQVIQRIKRLAL